MAYFRLINICVGLKDVTKFCMILMGSPAIHKKQFVALLSQIKQIVCEKYRKNKLSERYPPFDIKWLLPNIL